MKMLCPHCGVNGTVDDSLVGRKVKCPKCTNVFVVSAEGSAPIEVEAMELEEFGTGEALLSGSTASDVADDLDISDLLRPENNKEDFPSEKCSACGQAVHPALLMEVNSKMYCAGCVPEYILSAEYEEEVIDEDISALDPSAFSSEDEVSEVAPTREKETTDKKSGTGKWLKLLLLFLLITLACAAAVVYMDIQLI